MIKVDGSFGEGGGAILRVSVGLAAALGETVRVFNIRASRPNPGLRAQHLTGILACAELTDGEVSGAHVGSKEVAFKPGGGWKKRLKVSVGTAGSATLVLQTLLIPASLAGEESVVEVSGGTDVAWSPPADYLRNVTLPVLKRCGLDAEADILRRGYYPAGGGKLRLKVKPSGKNPLELKERGRLLSVQGISHAHEGLKEKEVAERQKKSCRKTLFDGLAKLGLEDAKIDVGVEYSDAVSFGSGIVLWAQFENTVLGADSLGEKGKRAEDVGREAAESMISELASNAPTDKYMTDQAVPYLALFGGSVRTPALSAHAETNIWIAKQFGAHIESGGSVVRAEPIR